MHKNSVPSELYAVVPAAGVGSRMMADRPKQYLLLDDQTILEHTLTRLLNFPAFKKIIVSVSQDDPYWPDLDISKHTKIQSCVGGKERYHSVLNGLQALLDDGVSRNAWVMVHDVARPCIAPCDLQNLLMNAHEQGSVLGMKVRDTMKRSNDQGQIDNTVDRDLLWHALTPQMAPLGVLFDAIKLALVDGIKITDEASALEYVGLQPIMVAGHASNIKVTHPDDLDLARAFMQLPHLKD